MFLFTASVGSRGQWINFNPIKTLLFHTALIGLGISFPGIFNSLQSELKKKSLKFLDAFTEASIKLKKMESNQLRTGRKSYSANGGLIG